MRSVTVFENRRLWSVRKTPILKHGLALLVLAISACGGTNGNNAETSSIEDDLKACIAARGLSAEPPDEPSPEDTKARLDCASQAGVDLPYDEPEEIRRMTEGSYAFVACMRDEGWDVADPVKSDVGEFMKPPSLYPPADPNRAVAFDASRDSCWESAYEEAAPPVVAEGEELDGDEGVDSKATTEQSEP